ncbi:MAG: Dam family site-specific DNA-(adenine-N6)-methyltransferase [bacterium]|nr:Dam family site-specific DNA-(adenine-N6)-methyltransferase [bacterium]
MFTKAIERPRNQVPPFKSQLLKWVGNKQRFAHEIISYFPADFGTYYEPFLGTGAVLATLAPEKAVGSDVLEPLVQIFQTLLDDPRKLLRWYETRWTDFQKDRNATYRKIQARYSKKANAADLVFLSRSCYGGVIRFRKDGYISTPIGVHAPISPASMKMRVDLWRERLAGATFVHSDFEATIDLAQEGDVVYCDPPYYDTQSILYGAQSFSLERLYKAISSAKARGAYIALSIDGHKKSGTKACDIPLPEDGLFERALAVNCGRSMLKRFQMEGKSLESEVVSDRLLLSWS